MFMIMKNNTSNNSWQLPEDGIDFAYRPASGQWAPESYQRRFTLDQPRAAMHIL